MGIKERKQHEKEMRTRQIMNAAKKVFSAKGFNSATVEEIAREAELSPGTLYTYFKNKDELYASLNLKLLRYMFKRLQDLYDEEGLTTEQKFDRVKDVLCDAYNFEPLILISVLHLQASKEFWNLSDRLYSEIKDLNTKSARIIAKIFEDGVQEGIFIDCHPVAISDIVWAVFSGLVLWEESKRMFDPRKNYLEKTLDLATEIISRGIKRTSK